MELREEGRFVSQGQDSLLHHCTFDVVVLDHDIFLQDLYSVQLLRRLHLSQHHLQRGEMPRAKATIRQRLKKNQANEKAQEHLFSLTLPKLPFPSRARKLKSLSRTRSIFPDGKLNRRWSDGVITFLPCPSFAFCRDRRVLGYRLHSLTCQIESN